MTGFLPNDNTDREAATPVNNLSFFPSVSVGDLEKAFSIPKEISNSVAVNLLILALSEVNRALSSYVFDKEELGVLSLDMAAQQDKIANGESLYKTAVYAKAKSLLMKESNALGRQPNKENDTNERKQDNFEEISTIALNQILGRGRISFQLI
jgi:hypothetical protein